MNSLNNLLAHEIKDLYSAEEQIIEALPQMIEKAQNQELKRTLNEHLKITEQQKKRLDKVQKLLEESGASIEEEDTVCLGMQGLIEEGQKIMNEDMEPEVMDAAITAAAQKIEHYEISAYGTACAYARELKLKEVEKLLQQTLDEEYEADGLLTELAVGGLNVEAESGEEEDISVRKIPEGRKKGRTAARKTASRSNASGNGSAKKSAKSTRTSKSSSARKTTSRSKTAKAKKSHAR